MTMIMIRFLHCILAATTLGSTVQAFTTRPPLAVGVSASSSAKSTKLEAAEHNFDYDLVVLGGGIVGVQAALAAATYNKRVCLIDAPREAGVLMNGDEDLSLGAPTGLFGKALRDTSKQIKVSTLRGMNLREDSIWNEIILACVDLASSNAVEMRRQLGEAGVAYIKGLASFTDSGGTNSLSVAHSSSGQQQVQTVTSDKVLIATGSAPFRLGGVPFDGKRIFDSDSINQLSFLPKSIAITGSGIVALEYAKIFRNLGAEVTMIIRDKNARNALQKIGVDKDVAAYLVADLARSGIKIIKGAQVGSFKVPASSGGDMKLDTPITIGLEARGGGPITGGQESEIKCLAYLAAVGRKPNTSKLNLQAVSIATDEYGGILVNPDLSAMSTNPDATSSNVYAAGDVLGRPFLASTGTAQGLAAVVGMFATDAIAADEDGNDNKMKPQPSIGVDPKSLASNPFAVPAGIWSSPEAAYFGLSLDQAEEMMGKENVGEGMALYSECLRGRIFSPNGLLKLVFEKPTGHILGVHICGEDACELIHFGMELVNGKRTLQDLKSQIFAAVTYHELYSMAAGDGINPSMGRKRRAAAGRAQAKRNRLFK